MENEDEWVLPKPQNLPAMGRDEFSYAFTLATHAGHHDVPMENPEQFGINIEDEAGNLSRIRFRDMPLNRAMMAMRDHFGEDKDGFVNFTYRFLALIDVLRRGLPKKYLRESEDDPEAQEVHPVIIYSAAETPFNRQMQFNRKRFLANAAAIEKSIGRQ